MPQPRLLRRSRGQRMIPRMNTATDTDWRVRIETQPGLRDTYEQVARHVTTAVDLVDGNRLVCYIADEADARQLLARLHTDDVSGFELEHWNDGRWVSLEQRDSEWSVTESAPLTSTSNLRVSPTILLVATFFVISLIVSTALYFIPGAPGSSAQGTTHHLGPAIAAGLACGAAGTAALGVRKRR